MNRNEYNGWTNYETWCISLWMDNDQGDHIHWAEQAREILAEYKDEAADELAAAIKIVHEENVPPGLENAYGDLLNAALSEVDWYEIAEALIETAKGEIEHGE